MSHPLDKNSAAVRKRLEAHTYEGEEGEEYGPSRFGEFGDYFRRKKIKLLNEDRAMREAAPEKPQIFKGIVAHVASYTQPSLEELRRELVLHGALFVKYLDYKTMVTHIIATTLPPKKADEWRRLRIVTPAWVVDSVAAGKRLPWADYRLLTQGPQQKTIRFDGGGRMAVQDGRPSAMAGYREQSKDSFYVRQMERVAARYDTGESVPWALKQLQVPAGMCGDGDNSNADVAEEEAGESSLDDLDQLSPELKKDGEGQGEGKSEGEGEGKDEGDGDGDGNGDGTGTCRPVSDNVDNSDKHPPAPLTSEQHNAMLLSDPKIRQTSAANPDFLQQFFSESRLHHLSTWKAELKSKMQQLAAASQQKQKLDAAAAAAAAAGGARYIMHVDFDCFFCAVSLKRVPPEYAARPAAVAHSSGDASEIASCNYPARARGVRNGMWMKQARKLCPDLRVLPYDFPAYEEASRCFYEALAGVGGVVQSVSVDEALLDVTDVVVATANNGNGPGISDAHGNDDRAREQAAADQLATALRQQVRTATGCEVSVGIGGNVLLAKVALRRAKPAGQAQLRPGAETLAVLGALAVEQLPGVAGSLGGKLAAIGVQRVGELRALTRERLIGVLGPRTGARLWEYARGIDGSVVGGESARAPRKSVSAEVNWGIRFVTQAEADAFVRDLCAELERRLLHEQVRGRKLTLKILRRAAHAPLDPPKHLGHGECDVFSKSVALGVATHSAETLGREAVAVLRSFCFAPGDLRGLGVQLQKLEPLGGVGGAAGGMESGQKKLHFVAAAPPLLPPPPPPPAPVPSPPPLSRPSSPPLSPPFPSTQFFMPTCPDPSVLAELPPEIRDRLVAPLGHGSEERSRVETAVTTADEDDLAGLPPEIDREVLRALPADVRAEVLAEYLRETRPRAPAGGGSPVRALAQRSPSRLNGPASRSPSRASPTRRAPRTSPAKKKLLAPAPGPVRRGGAKAARERLNDAKASRVQTSLFVGRAMGSGNDGGGGGNGNGMQLDPDVLAELPDDVRAEVLADFEQQQQQQRQRLQAPPMGLLRWTMPERRGLSLLRKTGRALRFEPPKPALVFSTPLPSKTSIQHTAESESEPGSELALSLAEMKHMLQAWHAATRDEGPHEADVAMLEEHLAGVVTEERDMGKARSLVAWLAWLVEEGRVDEEKDNGNDCHDDDDDENDGQQNWRMALERLKEAVQTAVAARGLGALQFT